MFENYCGVPFHMDYPIILPVAPIVRGNMRQILLKMACVLTQITRDDFAMSNFRYWR